MMPQGILEPPEEIKEVIDKTVGYVKRNGKNFEKRLIGNNEDKFEFLNEDDKYHQYYRWKLDGEKLTDVEISHASDVPGDTPASNISEPRTLNFLTRLPTISSMDLEVIKFTALAVVENGAGYLEHLLSHERDLGHEAQFEFLRKDHSLFPLFMKYVQQYTLLSQFYSGTNNIEVDSINRTLRSADSILKIAFDRAVSDKVQKTKVQKEKKVREDKKLCYASIDWQDFSIVEKSEFDAIDQVRELSTPLNRDSLVFRTLESKRQDIDLPKMEVKAPLEPKENTPNHNEVLGKRPKGMKIKAAGESRIGRLTQSIHNTKENLVKCPITGKQIPQLKFDDHLRILLRDPRYKEQQDNFMKKNFKFSSNLTTDEVYENIKRIARKRENTDYPKEHKRSQIGPS
ncbi:uncharacterized protein PRCAT00003668001 [Priceomyces carsonii]|uniref:uncharacterized protein n=1 Tax=Priceomyces carsonii TaxID=28549 RepID=UPI002EDB710F|nr:unnamed protein product [Priceomyces carsonii]